MFTKIKSYFQEVISQLKQTSWPSKSNTQSMTILVIVVAILLAFYLGGIDFLLQKIMGLLI
jgi:preprotein translocase SecE subunit